MDNLLFEKIWQDTELMQLRVLCSSSIAMACTEIYVNEILLNELIDNLKLFLAGRTDGCIWANETRGNGSTACLELRFIKQDKLGHVLIEVFAELDDGGEYSKHNSCFYIKTEMGLLGSFCAKLENLKLMDPLGFQVELNDV